MDPTNRNTGVIQEAPNPLDFRVGAETGIAYQENLPTGDWQEFLPKDEAQWLGFETSACVSFSAHNIIETQVEFMIKTGRLTGDKLNKLKEWGFFDDTGRFNVSDRFTAKMSGTTILGNSLRNVWESIRLNGLVPESMWPAEGVESWAEWNAEIPQHIQDYAKNILTILDFKWEWVVTGNCGPNDISLLKKHLKQSPLQLAAPSCPRNGELVQSCKVCVTQHATMLYNIDMYLEQYDSYDTFRRLLGKDYLLPYVAKAVVLVKEPATPATPAPFGHTFTKTIYYGSRNDEETMWLQKALLYLTRNQKFKASVSVLVTGNYASRTRLLVREFQTQYQLASPSDIAFIDGRWVGPATRKKLNELLS